MLKLEVGSFNIGNEKSQTWKNSNQVMSEIRDGPSELPHNMQLVHVSSIDKFIVLLHPCMKKVQGQYVTEQNQTDSVDSIPTILNYSVLTYTQTQMRNKTTMQLNNVFKIKRI